MLVPPEDGASEGEPEEDAQGVEEEEGEVQSPAIVVEEEEALLPVPVDPWIPPCIARTQLAPELLNAVSPLDTLNYFLDDDVLTLITLETNSRMAERADGGEGPIGGKHPTDPDELCVLLGVLLHLSQYKGALYKCWQKGAPQFDMTAFNSIRWHRFKRLVSHLACAHGSSADPWHKVRPLVDRFADRCQRSLVPSDRLCIDDEMIGYRGRDLKRQFVRGKRHPHGFKNILICDATFGILLGFELYSGRKVVGSEKGYTKRVVEDLSRPYQGKWRCVYVDKYFTGPQLARSLFANRTCLVGSLNLQRVEFDAGELSLPRHAALHNSLRRSQGDICYTVYRGEHLNHIMSTGRPVVASLPVMDMGRVVGRRPTIVEDYNLHSHSVDQFDQHLSANAIIRKSKRWYMSIFWWVINAARVQAFLIFRILHPLDPSASSMEAFVNTLSAQLIAGRTSPRTDVIVQLQLPHIHAPRMATRAAPCQYSGCRRRQLLQCLDCDVHLCQDHWVPWHCEWFRRCPRFPGKAPPDLSCRKR